MVALGTIFTGAAEVAEQLLNSTVFVRAGWGNGSGVIWTADGLIITNSHVVHRDEAIVILRDKTELPAKLVARDRHHDLAALQVDRQGLPATIPGDSTRVRPGQLVLAVGHPMGMRDVVTAGIVTGVGQIGGEPGRELRDLIQADVALAPGNSGGPLADAEGRVIGINAMIGMNGMALAVPTAAVQQLLAFRREKEIYVGIQGLAVQTRVGGKPRSALLLTSVEEGSPAERAGLLQGDVLLAFDGQPIETGEQFLHRLHARQPGETVRLAVLRANQAAEVTVVPAERTLA